MIIAVHITLFAVLCIVAYKAYESVIRLLDSDRLIRLQKLALIKCVEVMQSPSAPESAREHAAHLSAFALSQKVMIDVGKSFKLIAARAAKSSKNAKAKTDAEKARLKHLEPIFSMLSYACMLNKIKFRRFARQDVDKILASPSSVDAVSREAPRPARATTRRYVNFVLRHKRVSVESVQSTIYNAVKRETCAEKF